MIALTALSIFWSHSATDGKRKEGLAVALSDLPWELGK